MGFKYEESFFMDSMPSIINNKKLRLPQHEAYTRLKEYYEKDDYNRNALIVLPTGVGKTGVMAIVPFGISKGRVLIITPWTSIRDSVVNSLNPDSYDNFWLKREIFKSKSHLPNLIEYDGTMHPDVLKAANIVVLNIHKLQSRLDSALINIVSDDFFDMIIIDEAHHSTAKTWVECVEYFKNAKVVKLTGTPFRTDGQEISGELVYKYSLSRAMVNNYVKSLQNNTFIPEQLYLTIDGDNSKKYTVEEIFDMEIKDTDWVKRSVAYSTECSSIVVDKSIEMLEEKLALKSKLPHKILAVACSIKHAEEIADLYESRGYKVALIHSELPAYVKESRFNDIDNHRVNVVVNVAMLGEGYDHPHLSVAAIFRPFKNELPYVQFIGRILRFIEGDNLEPEDNIGQIVSHHHLYLDELWEKYKIEIQESEIIKRLREYDDYQDIEPPAPSNKNGEAKIIDISSVSNVGEGKLSSENYLDTELTNRSKKKDEEYRSKVDEMVKLLNISESQAELMIKQLENADSSMNRPDLAYNNKRKGLDNLIKEDIVPRLIREYNIEEKGDSLKNSNLFVGKYWYIPNNIPANNGMLVVYFNQQLMKKFNKKREELDFDELNLAYIEVEKITKLVEGVLSEEYKRKDESYGKTN